MRTKRRRSPRRIFPRRSKKRPPRALMRQVPEHDYRTLVALVARFGPLSGTLLVACKWPGKLYLLRVIHMARKLQRAWRARCARLKGQRVAIFASVNFVAPALEIAIKVSAHRLKHLRVRRKRRLEPLWTRWLIKLSYYKGVSALRRKQRARLCVGALLGWAIVTRTANGFKDRKMLRALAMMRMRETLAAFQQWMGFIARRRRAKILLRKSKGCYRGLEAWHLFCKAHDVQEHVARMHRGKKTRAYLEDLSRCASMVQARFRGLAGRRRYEAHRTLLMSYSSDKGKRAREKRRSALEQEAVRDADARALDEATAMLRVPDGRWMLQSLAEERFVRAAGGGGYGNKQQRLWAITTAHRVMAQSRALVAFRRRRPPQFVCANPCCLRAYASSTESDLCNCMGSTAVPTFIGAGLLLKGFPHGHEGADSKDAAQAHSFAVEEEAAQMARAAETEAEVAEADRHLSRKKGYDVLLTLRAVAAVAMRREIDQLELCDIRASTREGEALDGPPKPKPPVPAPPEIALKEARRLKALELAGEITMAELTEAEDRLYGRPPPPPSEEELAQIRTGWRTYIEALTILCVDRHAKRMSHRAFISAKEIALKASQPKVEEQVTVESSDDSDDDPDGEARASGAPPPGARGRGRPSVSAPAPTPASQKAPKAPKARSSKTEAVAFPLPKAPPRPLVGMTAALVTWELRAMRWALHWKRNALKKRKSANLARTGASALFQLYDVAGTGKLDVKDALLLAREYLPMRPSKKAVVQLEKVIAAHSGINFGRWLSWANFQLQGKKPSSGGWGTLLASSKNRAPRPWMELAQRRFDAKQGAIALLGDTIKTRSRRLLHSQVPLVLSYETSTPEERAHCLPKAALADLDGGTALGFAVLMILGLHTAYGVCSPPSGVFAASGSGWRAVRMITAAAGNVVKDHAAAVHANLGAATAAKAPSAVKDGPRTVSTTLRNSILMLKLREHATLHLSGELSDAAFAVAKAALLTAHRDAQESQTRA